MQTSPYELWIEYLREAGEENWSDQVKEDFAGCLTTPLKEWMQEATWVRNLFFDPSEVPAVDWDEGQPLIEHRQFKLVVDLTASDAVITEHVIAYVRARRIAYEWERPTGRPKFVVGNAKYPFVTRPDVEALKVTLYAYRLWKDDQANDKKMSMWEIGVELMKEFPIMLNQRLLPPVDSKPDPDAGNKKRLIANTVDRYLKRADKLIEGVKAGRFPDV